MIPSTALTRCVILNTPGWEVENQRFEVILSHSDSEVSLAYRRPLGKRERKGREKETEKGRRKADREREKAEETSSPHFCSHHSVDAAESEGSIRFILPH